MTFNHLDKLEGHQPTDGHRKESADLFNQISPDLEGAFKQTRSGAQLTDQSASVLNMPDPSELYQSEAFHWGTTQKPNDLVATVQDTETELPLPDDTQYPGQDYYKVAGSEPNPGIKFPGPDWHKAAGSEPNPGIKYPEPSFYKVASSERAVDIKFPGQDWHKSTD